MTTNIEEFSAWVSFIHRCVKFDFCFSADFIIESKLNHFYL